MQRTTRSEARPKPEHAQQQKPVPGAVPGASQAGAAEEVSATAQRGADRRSGALPGAGCKGAGPRHGVRPGPAGALVGRIATRPEPPPPRRRAAAGV
ncbi:hypothetical protein HYH03_011586 [Edaphochlamys debaryana]|uniref:Uncharacterized protein n=1 Tax=Edaphochlamys debaryana TaxID=47281 RepID=A0A836BUV0_9CHLO|nr:hypothetical protein HYH03_011586 [Edaphochlamys debaryana]|eukprot:KAG2489956.1 hypothetical protein HYH03_011586 [Edaphochlamys debaryana]